jgi:hypothetical protein
MPQARSLSGLGKPRTLNSLGPSIALPSREEARNFTLASPEVHHSGLTTNMIFNLLGALALMVAFLGLCIHFLWLVAGRPGSPPLPNGCLLLIFLPLILTGLLWGVAWLGSPTVPEPSDLIGKYEIDRHFHPGEQADWQNQTYQMELTMDEVILTDSRTDTVWRYPVLWGFLADYCWEFVSQNPRHHMFQGGPALVREPFGHYYIFQSPLYGDVVFRKKKEGLRWSYWFLVPLVLVMLILRTRSSSLFPDHRKNGGSCASRQEEDVLSGS